MTERNLNDGIFSYTVMKQKIDLPLSYGKMISADRDLQRRLQLRKSNHNEIEIRDAYQWRIYCIFRKNRFCAITGNQKRRLYT